MGCKHGMPEAFCSLCNPPKQPAKRIPQHTKTTTVFGSSSITSRDIPNLGYAVIHTNKGREHHSFGNLDNHTTMVHIDGHPFLWAVEKILASAPNLKSLRVIPSQEKNLLESHRELCRAKGVSIILGHHRPELAWDDGENRSPFYQKQATFFKNLQGEQKQLWEELRMFSFEEAEIAARYFCLDGEDYLPQRVLAEQYGFEYSNTQISTRINAVLFYLDASFVVGARSRQFARAIKARVGRLRIGLTQTHTIASLRQEAAKRLGLQELPEKLPLSRLETFEELVKRSRNGKLKWLKTYHERLYKIVVLRYGLSGGRYRTLEEIGQSEYLTRERIRQLEEKALVLLGIEDELSDHRAPAESPVQ